MKSTDNTTEETGYYSEGSLYIHLCWGYSCCAIFSFLCNACYIVCLTATLVNGNACFY